MRSSVGDFSEQFTEFTVPQGYYASEEVLQDYLGPLLKLDDLDGLSVCEVGCGHGRFLKVMSKYARHVTGIEPSEAIGVAKEYMKDCPNVTLVNESIYDIDGQAEFDIVFCLGVLHHLPDPVKAVEKIHGLTKPGGRAVIWVYGKEGNKLYLAVVKFLRIFTTRIPHKRLKFLSKTLTFPLKVYIASCRLVWLPLRRYMRELLAKMDNYSLALIIYDQLNPSIAEYWSKNEFETILLSGGFREIALWHRHGYSWTALLKKAEA